MNKIVWVGIALGLIVGGCLLFIPRKTEAPLSADERNTPVEEVVSTTITFVGDMMFDRYIREKNHDSRYVDVLNHELLDYLNKSDLVIGNLEGPITTSQSVARYESSEPTHFQFTFDKSVVDFLRRANIQGVSLGNNHILNFGPYGLRETLSFLEEAEIHSFGNPLDISHSWETEINKISFGFIAENEFDSIPFETRLEEVRRLDRENDHVIVFAHWGDEYASEPNQAQIEKARTLIDAGADLIIGAHPHVIQPRDEYQGKYIYYSLGNFIFDQYFSPDVRCGLIPTLEFTTDSISVLDEKTTLLTEDGRTTLEEC